MLTQNKKLASLWYDLKNNPNEDLESQLEIFHRWMKAMCVEEGNVVGALAID